MSEDPEGIRTRSGISTLTKDFLPGYPTLTDFSNEGLKSVAEASKAFQSLPPAGPLWDLQKSYPEFRRAMKNCRTRIEPLIKILLEHEMISTHNYGSRIVAEKLEFLIDANDDILERVGTALDDAEGLFKRAEVVAVDKAPPVSSLNPPGTWGKKKTFSSASTGGDYRDNSARLASKQPIIPVNVAERPIKKAIHRIRVTEKPQVRFADSIDNTLGPFVPKLKLKPNSIKPLSILPEYASNNNEEFYGHPYEVELNRWEPLDWMMEKCVPIPPIALEDTPLVLVVTPDELDSMIFELRGLKEIAVDVEHHSYRTFLGLSCVIQISTREKDYVIDALTLWRELEALNEIFTNPKVLKVFHGSACDIEWLQRDFGVYVVGLFDTYLAMKQLNFVQFSLQHLLAHFCSIHLDKTFQLADWRLRPLPKEMIEYARKDTHFLLFIHDLLKNKLLENGNQFKNLLTSVYDQSKSLCLKRYEKPGRNPQLALRKARRSLNNRQIYAFTELYNWRDNIAREKDESLGFVLPNHMLLTIADTLPKEMTGILACCEPVPLLVHQFLGDLHRIVSRARDLPLHEDKVEHSGPDKRKKEKDWMILLNSIHDVQLNPSKTENKDEVYHWPQPWIAPDGWEKIQLATSSSFPLGRAGGVKVKPSRVEKSSAFERYELSNHILDILRNPHKKDSLDMDDPLVRVVRETLLADTSEKDKPLCTASENKATITNENVDKVLPEKDFVAFNPMGYSKRPGKKKRGSPPRSVPPKVEEITIEDSGDELTDSESGESYEPTISVPLPKSKYTKQRKPHQLNFLNKVKLPKKKGKKRKQADHDEIEVSVVNNPKPKKLREGSGGKKGGRGGKFFTNPFRSKEGKSVTFKK